MLFNVRKAVVRVNSCLFLSLVCSLLLLCAINDPFSLYVVFVHILSTISHAQHHAHVFIIRNIRCNAFSLHLCDHWWLKKKKTLQTDNSGDSTQLLTRSDWSQIFVQGVHILLWAGELQIRDCTAVEYRLLQKWSIMEQYPAFLSAPTLTICIWQVQGEFVIDRIS